MPNNPENNWLKTYEENRDKLIAAHAYNPEDEHANCGVGLVASIDGTPRRDVVEMSIQALKNVWHRGAVDADGKTCLLYTSPSPRDRQKSRMPSSA